MSFLVWKQMGVSRFLYAHSTLCEKVEGARWKVSHYREPCMRWFHPQQNKEVYFGCNRPSCRLHPRVWVVHVGVQGVPLQIVFGYSILQRHWIRGIRRRFAVARYLFLHSTRAGLHWQICHLGQHGGIVGSCVFEDSPFHGTLWWGEVHQTFL